MNAHTTYDRSYPERRAHFDPAIGALKVRTLRYWMRKLGIRTADLAVCEVGFGGGFCLSHLRTASRRVFGVEAIRENIEHAVQLGIDPDSLYQAGALPTALVERSICGFFKTASSTLMIPVSF
jgi:hypothetical protein